MDPPPFRYTKNYWPSCSTIAVEIDRLVVGASMLLKRTGWILSFVAVVGCGDDRPRPVPAAREPPPQPTRPAKVDDSSDSLSSASVAQLSRLISQRWTFDLDSMVARRVVRVLVVPSKMLYFEDRGRIR